MHITALSKIFLWVISIKTSYQLCHASVLFWVCERFVWHVHSYTQYTFARSNIANQAGTPTPSVLLSLWGHTTFQPVRQHGFNWLGCLYLLEWMSRQTNRALSILPRIWLPVTLSSPTPPFWIVRIATLEIVTFRILASKDF